MQRIQQMPRPNVDLIKFSFSHYSSRRTDCASARPHSTQSGLPQCASVCVIPSLISGRTSDLPPRIASDSSRSHSQPECVPRPQWQQLREFSCDFYAAVKQQTAPDCGRNNPCRVVCIQSLVACSAPECRAWGWVARLRVACHSRLHVNTAICLLFIVACLQSRCWTCA